MKLVKFNGDGADADIDNKATHATNPSGLDYTLCGVTMDGDPSTAGSFEMIEEKYITCPDCVRIIKFCKTLFVREAKNDD